MICGFNLIIIWTKYLFFFLFYAYFSTQNKPSNAINIHAYYAFYVVLFSFTIMIFHTHVMWLQQVSPTLVAV